jgi:septation ring formation regulator EzrA
VNKDIEDALEKMRVDMRQLRNEVEALATQYNLRGDVMDSLDQIRNQIQSVIDEINELVP